MKKRHILWVAILSTMGFVDAALADGPRNYLYIVGSTTVAPFTEAAAGKIEKSAKLKRPLLESDGTNGGFRMFCEGTGMDYPDIVNAFRPIRKREFDICQANGVGDIVEGKIGYDALVIVVNKKAKPMMGLTLKDLYLALAKQVPDPACNESCDKLVTNPYKTWKQIDPALPDVKIEVFGPPSNSGFTEVFAEAVLEAGCNKYPLLAAKKANNGKEYKRACDNIREDGVYVEETGEMIADRLDYSNPDTVGIINYSRLKENASHLQALKLEGVAPDYESIATQSYPLARPLFFYVKKAHVTRIPGFQAFIAEFTSEKALGPKGYLISKGLVAMSAQELKTTATDLKTLKPMPSPN